MHSSPQPWQGAPVALDAHCHLDRTLAYMEETSFDATAANLGAVI